MPWYTWVLTIAVGVTLGLIMSNRKPANKEVIHIVNEKDFRDNMRKGQLIDIRKKDEYEKGHIKGARNFERRHVLGKYTKLRKDQAVFMYCSNGNKSLSLAKKMSKENFKAVYILENGFQQN